MRISKTIAIALCCAATACASIEGGAPAPLKFVDAHTHLMIENITPDEEIALLKSVGLSGVVFMHPDAEAVAAYARKYPDFVTPSLGVARTGNGLHLDDSTGAAMTKAYKDGAVCSFGEVNGMLFGDNEQLRGIYAAAAETGAPVNFHIDLSKPGNLPALEKALKDYPKAKIVLAHLGWTAGPELIGRLLDTYPNLYTDLSIRLDAPGSLPWRNNGLDLSILTAEEQFPPAWRALIERRPDRFLFAMDINSFGPRYTIAADLMSTARKALAPLSRPVQEAVAHGNIERLLRGCHA